ncbi:AarF domain-containing kinase 1, partial [Pseudolycoriella hygida]
MWPLKRLAKYTIVGGAATATGVSLHANDYDLNSLGIIRLSRAVITVYNIGWAYKSRLYRKEWDKSSEEYQQEKSKTHLLAAQKLLNLICVNKGVYIKVGQHIGSLDYLLPPEYVSTMKVLHSNAPKNPVEDLFKVIRQDLKVNPEDLFESFDPEPLGTASLAQVHKATLKTGEKVAVKVQHPFVKGNSIVDMKTMEYLCKVMAWVFPDFKMQWLVDETKKNLPKELNFLHEGENAEKAAKMFQNYKWLKVPKIYWELSTQRVLTMDFLEGGQVNDLEYIESNKIDPFEVANKIGQLYSNMIFTNGFVHSDPHPGNILLKKTPKGVDIILLDHGLYATLTDQFRYNYSKLWLSILKTDRDGMRSHSQSLGIKRELYPLFACMLTGRAWESVMAGIDKIKHSSKEKETLQNTTGLVLPHISDILEHVDRQMLLVLKTNDLIRNIESTLGTQNRMTSFLVMSKCCVKSVFRQDKLVSRTKWSHFKITLWENWTIFKLNIYYLYLGLKNFNFFSSIKQLV